MSQSPTRVGVVVVNYNGGACLIRCLQCLTAQQVAPAHIVVVDNASEDGSWQDCQTRFPSITFLPQSSNLGFAAANNLGVEYLGDCQWIALVNPDAYVAPDWLTSCLDAIASSNVDMISCRTINAKDQTLLDGDGDVYHVSGLGWRRGYGRSLNSATGSSNQDVFSPCAAAALYRRSAFVEVGGFDEDFFCYIEDVDLGFRLRLKGAKCLHLSDVSVLHEGSAISGYRSDFAIYHGHRNMLWCYIKNMPTGLLWRYSLQHLAINVVSILYLTLQGKGRAVLTAKWHGLRGLSRQWRKRQAIQASVVISNDELLQAMRRGVLAPYRRR